MRPKLRHLQPHLWIKERKGAVERIRSSVHEIASSGHTLSKLAVAASLLGDLVRQ